MTTTHLPLIHSSLITSPLSSFDYDSHWPHYSLHSFTIILSITVVLLLFVNLFNIIPLQSPRDHTPHPPLITFFLVAHSTTPSFINEHTPGRQEHVD